MQDHLRSHIEVNNKKEREGGEAKIQKCMRGD